jgi:hypothetical protein
VSDARPSLPELIAAPRGPSSRNLVFASAGDRGNLRRWLKGRRDFDLWIVYYGERPDPLRELADFYVRRRGSKFQNLQACYQRWPERFAQYEAVMVLDDDIIINATSISSLFAIRRELDLWALQPAFRLRGKISWDITRVRPTARLRYTNFIEMTCPVIRRDKLDAFMAVYDPELVGYGIDWWLLKSMGELEGRLAVVDHITCVNPDDRSKGGTREIDRLQSKAQRQEIWERMKKRHGLEEVGRVQQEYRRIDRSALGALAGLAAYLPDWIYIRSRRLAGRLARSLWS